MLVAELHSFLGGLVLLSGLGRILDKCLFVLCFCLFVRLFVLSSYCPLLLSLLTSVLRAIFQLIML